MNLILVKNKLNNKFYRVLEDAILLQDNQEHKIIIYKELYSSEYKLYSMIRDTFWKEHELINLNDLPADMD